ncbi:type IV pili methyl-accepting chemotaxis transducer N-terminal domain-containing protein [Flagellimonas sp. MMG031]|uniref:histidine kinase n=1 Tax=Flagellimonas sp. MMG031 TaxID=3158549 RepID=A0AAU7MWL3_9FLAO
MNNPQLTLDVSTFLRIRKWYLLALSAIALTIIIAQILIQNHLNSQLDDSRVINVAGRQRAYSQKLVKEALLLNQANLGESEQQELLKELAHTLYIWRTSHLGLQMGNDSIGLPKENNVSILEHFDEISIHHSAMVDAIKTILSQKDTSGQALDILLANEGPFLEKMDAMVNAYDAISKERLQKLKVKEYLLLCFSLLILVLEVLFIFRPLSIQIKETIRNLVKSQLQSEENTKEIKKIFEEKERSLQELKELNFVIDNAALFTSARSDGTVVFISKKFLTLLNESNIPPNTHLSEILTTDEGQRQYLGEILTKPRKSIRTEEIEIKTKAGNKLWLDMSIIPMHQTSLKQSVLLLCSDITERKNNQEKVEQLTLQNYEDRMRQKQLQASLIVEGQEEERKRIAKDIHDGIGQMLTALRFNIESINLDQKERTKEKIAYLKELTSDLIKGVRTATFNLTPPELGDHGIFPALQKMTSELSKLTGKSILFENKAEQNIRFDSLAETNIYRVTQEAVNNAIKYADANYILVSINLTDNVLSVVIDDDGKGFDPTILDRPPKNSSEGGMGVFFMKERISYINGRLFINSSLGQGTRVTINYNLNDTKKKRNV